MVEPGITRDLSILTMAKLLVLAVIYVALFAPFAARPDDTATHLFGAPHHLTPGG